MNSGDTYQDGEGWGGVGLGVGSEGSVKPRVPS